MAPTLQLFIAQNGDQSARVVCSDGRTLHLHSAVDPRKEGDLFDTLDLWGDTVVLLGCGLGYHVVHAFKRSNVAAVIAVDLFDEAISLTGASIGDIVFNRTSLSPHTTLSDRRSIAQKLAARQGSVQVVRHAPSCAVDPAWYNEVLADLMPSPVAPQSAGMMSIKKALVFVGNFFGEKECVNALRATGIEPVIFRYTKPQSGFEYECLLQKCVEHNRADILISINMKGFDRHGVLRSIANRAGIPVIVWFVDDPHPIIVGQEENIGFPSHAFCWERSYLDYLKKCGFKNVQWLPLAADPEQFADLPSCASAIPLAFVGTPTMVDSIRERFLWSPSLEPVIVDCAEQILAYPDRLPAQILGDVLRHSGAPLPFTDKKNITWLIACFIHQATAIRRRKLLKPLVSSGIEFFGDPAGWRRLFGEKISAHPEVDYYTGLAAVYRRITININSTSCQMATAVNQRVFDIPLCRSFVLSDHQADLLELFDGSTEVVWYESAEDLKEKVAFYQKHDTIRQSIITAARLRILNEHTYQCRIAAIVQALRC